MKLLTIAVANLVSLSDLGFLCRCSISLSESNSPLHTQKSNKRPSHTELHLARETRCPPDPLSLTPLFSYKFSHKHFLFFLSGYASCLGQPYKSLITVFQVLLYPQTLRNSGVSTPCNYCYKKHAHCSEQAKQSHSSHWSVMSFLAGIKKYPRPGSILGCVAVCHL